MNNARKIRRIQTMKTTERNMLIEDNMVIAEICADKTAREFNLYAGGKYEREDLVQEAIIAMIEATPKYDDSRGVSYKTFVYAAMRNRLLEEIFKKKNNAKQAGRDGETEDWNGEYDELEFEDRDYIRSVAKYVKKVIDKYDSAIPTDVMIEKVAEGKTSAQIAEEMEIPIKAVYLKNDRIKRKAKKFKDEICQEMAL